MHKVGPSLFSVMVSMHVYRFCTSLAQFGGTWQTPTNFSFYNYIAIGYTLFPRNTRYTRECYCYQTVHSDVSTEYIIVTVRGIVYSNLS